MAALIRGKTTAFRLLGALRGRRGIGRLGCVDFEPRSLSAGSWHWFRGLACADVKLIRFGGDFSRIRCLGFCSQLHHDSGQSIEVVLNDDISGRGEIGMDDDELERSIGSNLKFLDDGEKCRSSLENRRYLQFMNEMVSASAHSVDSVLCKWTKEWEDIGHGEIYMAALELQKRRMYVKALKLMEWLEDNHRPSLAEEHYASHFHLICKVYGLEKAEGYVNRIPFSFQGEIVYRTILANCVSPLNLKKAETVFNKMRELQLPLSLFVCNQMVLLYKRLDVKKISKVLSLMKKENIKPDAETYHLLIDSKGDAKDVKGMEQLVKAMRSEGIEPDTTTYFILAKHYVSGGFKGKVLDMKRKMEAKEINRNPKDRAVLLSLCALLGSTKEMARVWKECELNPIMDEHMAAIETWGKLGQVEKAEAVFEKMYKKWKPLSSSIILHF